MKDIKISIIIPVYGVEKYIEQCLKSVFSQTYKNYECLLVDDCGNDRSIEIAQGIIQHYKGGAEIRIIHRTQNGGLSAARNSGLNEATGDYVLFLDSDDQLYPNSVLTLVSMVKSHPGVDIVQGGIEVQNGRNNFGIEEGPSDEYYDDVRTVRNLLIRGLPQTSWNKLIRLEFLKKNNILFNEGIIHEDELFRWNLHKFASSLCRTSSITYWYRTDNQNSIMKSSNQLRSLRCSIQIVKEISPELKTRSEVEFAIYNLKLRKASRISLCEDKDTITTEINEFRRKSKLPVALRMELMMWNLPFGLVKKTYVLAFCAGIRKAILLLTSK